MAAVLFVNKKNQKNFINAWPLAYHPPANSVIASAARQSRATAPKHQLNTISQQIRPTNPAPNQPRFKTGAFGPQIYGRVLPGNGMRIRFGRTRRARTGASATPAGAKTPTVSTPSIRHNGRSILPAAGAASSSACNSGSASNAANCEPYPAASYPSARTSQPRRDGNRTSRARTLPTRGITARTVTATG